MATRMQQRRATAAQWTSVNPVLAAGEIGFETDTNKFKIGNNVNAWDALDYFASATAFATESYVDTAVAGILDAAPETLDTLNELAAALNDDPAFFTNINSTITTGDSNTLASAQSYSDSLASNYDAAGSAATAESNANSYTDTEIANLIDTAPATLDTLNELAAALGDDANFSTTVTNSIATKAPLAQPLNAQSTSYTLQSSDNGGVVKASGTITITVPDAVFNAGERVDIVNTGTGVITISAGSGVTLLSKESAATIDTQYGAATLLFDSASQAFLIGDIA